MNLDQIFLGGRAPQVKPVKKIFGGEDVSPCPPPPRTAYEQRGPNLSFIH